MLSNEVMRAARAALLVLASIGGACADDPVELMLAPTCQPLFAGTECLLPYPSDFFLVPDASLPSGRALRVQLPAKPIIVETKASVDPNDNWTPDGYSTLTPIVTVLGSPVDPSSVVRVAAAPGDTASPTSHSLILDTTTGQLVPHFVDLDGRATDPARQALVLHPLSPLEPERRYVVALRGVLAPGGALAGTPEGFRRLRDGDLTGAPPLEAVADRYEAEVFAPLSALGVPRSELQLAWSFTTGSRARPTEDLRRIRELTEAWLASHVVTATVTLVTRDPRPETWLFIEGSFEAPAFLEEPGPGGRLARGADGRVEQRGTVQVQFTMNVPRAVREGFDPGPLLMFGHGFFGGRAEVIEAPMRQLGEALGVVTFAIDWVGMSQPDVFLVVEGLVGTPSRSFTFVERTHQAMANWIVASAVLRGPLAELAPLRRPVAPGAPGVRTSTDGATNAGALLYDASHPTFMGISQGHILGGVLAAVHPGLERVILQVGGAGFTLLMTRARPFQPFLGFLDQAVPDPLEEQKFIALAQTQLDRIDPGVYAHAVLTAPWPGSTPRRVLMQTGLGDVQVPNVGSWLHARALGLPLLQPAPQPVFGLSEVAAPLDGSALATYDFGIDPHVNDEARPPDLGNAVHGQLREVAPSLAQLRAFVHQGRVIHPCDGPCRIR